MGFSSKSAKRAAAANAKALEEQTAAAQETAREAARQAAAAQAAATQRAVAMDSAQTMAEEASRTNADEVDVEVGGPKEPASKRRGRFNVAAGAGQTVSSVTI